MGSTETAETAENRENADFLFLRNFGFLGFF